MNTIDKEDFQGNYEEKVQRKEKEHFDFFKIQIWSRKSKRKKNTTEYSLGWALYFNL